MYICQVRVLELASLLRLPHVVVLKGRRSKETQVAFRRPNSLA